MRVHPFARLTSPDVRRPLSSDRAWLLLGCYVLFSPDSQCPVSVSHSRSLRRQIPFLVSILLRRSLSPPLFHCARAREPRPTWSGFRDRQEDSLVPSHLPWSRSHRVLLLLRVSDFEFVLLESAFVIASPLSSVLAYPPLSFFCLLYSPALGSVPRTPRYLIP